MKISYHLKRLSLLALLLISYSTFACNFQLKLADSYGDGWGGGKVTVYVNGVSILVDKTITNGYGPIYFFFSVSTGDLITTNYTAGGDPSENEYWILDAGGNEIAHEGAGPVIPNDITTAISAVCPINNDLAITEWVSPLMGASPSSTTSISIKVKNVGLVSQSGFALKYSIDNGVTFITETYSSTLTAGSVITHTFSTTANMGTGGMYHCVGVVTNTGDGINSNDTLLADVYLCTTLSGNYTIGADASDDFNSIPMAINALDLCGVTGPVTFLIDTGVYEEQLVFVAVTGASSTNTITFESASGNPDDVIITNNMATLGTNYTIVLNGADYFTFKNLTIEATHHQFATVISLTNNALHNTFYGNVVKSSGTGTDSKAFFDYGLSNNNYNTYRKNKIEGAYYSFYIHGKGSTNLTKGTLIDSNDISHYFKAGMYLNYHDSLKVKSNNLYNEGAQAEYGINMFSVYNDFAISNNRVWMNNANQFTAIRLNYGNYYSYASASALPGMVANNMISMTSIQNGNPFKTGLSIVNSDSVIIANNSVLIANGSWSSNALYQSNTSSNTHGCKFVNNIFANFDGGYAAYFSSPSYTSTIDNNNYYATNSSKFVYWNGNKQDLSALQTASSKDANSISSVPIFFSHEDLHTLANATNNTGISVSGLTTDFDGDLRHATTPDIGADEYSQFNVDMMVEAWVLPVDTVSINGGNTIQIKVTNTGALARTNVPVKYSINNGQTFVTETISGTIQPDSSVVYTFTTLANFPSFGNKHCLALTNDAGELNPSNDTVFTDVFACSPLNGVYTLGHTASNDFISLAQFSMVLEHCGVSGPVTLNTDSGVYDGKVVFKNTSGASLSNTITIKGRGMETKLINTKAFEYSREVFEFDNAKFFILDSLYISKNRRSIYFTGIRFHNEADSNTVTNCIVNAGNAYYGFGIMAAWSSHSTASGGDNGDGLVINNNTIIGGARGIQISGNNFNDLCSDNHVTNNTLIGSGISFSYQSGGEISGNTVSGSSGISCVMGRNDLKVTYNNIDIQGAYYGIKLEYHNKYSPNYGNVLVANNTITNNSVAGGTAVVGIYNADSKNVQYFYNSIHITGSSTVSKAMFLNYAGSSGLELKNNIIANFADGYAIYTSISLLSFTNDYNMLFTNGTKFCYQGGSDKADLAAWKIASAGGTNSVYANPYFFSDLDLRTITLNDLGTSVALVTDDIDGTPRNATTPDIGAYEYDIPTSVDLGPDTTLCDGTALILTAEVATEYTGFEYYWVNGITGDTLTGSSMIFDVDSTGTYVVHVIHGSGYTLSDTIVVSPSVVVNFTGLLTNYCEDDYSSVLTGNPSGGAYSGAGISGTNFSPISAGIGSHDISYTYTDAATSCTVTKTIATVVNENPILNMSNDTSICPGDTAVIFATDTAVSNLTYYWSTGEATHNISVSPTSSTAFYATIDNGNCTTIDSVVVTVNALPVLSFTGLNAAYCQNDPASTLVGVPAGGVFSGSGISGSTYTPIVTGTNIVTYSYTDQVTTCSNTYNGFTLVNSLPNNIILGLDTSYCVSDSLVGLNFYPSADSISGTGIIQPNVFDPALANVGTHDIIFIYTDVNSCTNADTTEVIVHGLPVVNLTGLDASYCLNDANDTLVGTPIGGYYMGPGAYPEIFEPSIVGVGTQSIIYVFTDVFGCVNQDTATTIVYSLPTVTLPSDTLICADNSIVLDAGSFAGYSWNTGENTQTITVDTTGNGIGTTNINVVVTDQNTCQATDSINITFEALPISTLIDTATICGLNEQILLTASSNTGYDFLWSTGSTGSSILVNTADLGGATGYVSVSISTLNGCTTFDSSYVYFRNVPVPFIGNDTSMCWNKTIVLDAGSGFTTYNWNTGETTQTIALDSLLFSLGSNDYSVEVTNTENCSNADTILLAIDICTGILSPELKFENISVFPNPSNGNVEIEFTGLQNKLYYYAVYNSVGAMIFEGNLENSGNKTQIWKLDLSSKAKGVYYIQLKSEGQIKVEQLIVQ